MRLTPFDTSSMLMFTFQGKKTRKFRRKKQNKYESQPKEGLQDPWDKAVSISSTAAAKAKGNKADEGEGAKRLRRDEKRERGIIEYPRIEVVRDTMTLHSFWENMTYCLF